MTPQPEIIRSASISCCNRFRWTLTRKWGEGPMACYIGFNPSDADGKKEDPTTLAWIHFAKANGYSGYVAVNLYPFRSSDPKACRKWADFENNGPDWHARDVIIQNIELVARIARRSAIVVACWGNLAGDDPIAERIIEEIQGDMPFPAIYCLGLTKHGMPKHPMARGLHRIPRDQKFLLWRKA